MAVNRGKQFEKVIQKDIEKLPDTLIYRLYDTTSGYINICNCADFIVFRKPNFYFVECKSVNGTALPLVNLKQLSNMTSKIMNIPGCFGYFIVWFVAEQKTFVVRNTLFNRYLSNDETLLPYLNGGFKKSINYQEFQKMYEAGLEEVKIPKSIYKRVFAEYDFSEIF